MWDMDRYTNLFEYFYLYTLPSLMNLMLGSTYRYIIEPGFYSKLANVACVVMLT